MLQLRQKEEGSARFLELAEELAGLAREHGASLIVNDRPDIARLAGAAGVHVGQGDMPVAEARALAGPDAIVGLSTHEELQVEAALRAPATYLAVGPVFRTTTKVTGYAARGLSIVRYASGRGMPVVAIGGMTLDRVRLVVDAGATAIAVITDLFAGGDPEARTREYLAALGSIRRDPHL
jgi:thiamine-phosphate pyrophosphorylase